MFSACLCSIFIFVFGRAAGRGFCGNISRELGARPFPLLLDAVAVVVGGPRRLPFLTPSPSAKLGSCSSFASRDETAGKSSCVLGFPKLYTLRIAALAFASVSAASLLSGCAGAKSAWQSYARRVSRDIASGASQDRGGFASYTVHLGPQTVRREPDFKQPVEAMRGVTR